MTEITKYQQQKRDFLDSLQPDDFRNAASFNQVDFILEEINKSAINKKNPVEFFEKAVSHLFREGSPAVAKAINLFNAYSEMKKEITK